MPCYWQKFNVRKTKSRKKETLGEFMIKVEGNCPWTETGVGRGKSKSKENFTTLSICYRKAKFTIYLCSPHCQESKSTEAWGQTLRTYSWPPKSSWSSQASTIPYSHLFWMFLHYSWPMPHRLRSNLIKDKNDLKVAYREGWGAFAKEANFPMP